MKWCQSICSIFALECPVAIEERPSPLSLEHRDTVAGNIQMNMTEGSVCQCLARQTGATATPQTISSQLLFTVVGPHRHQVSWGIVWTAELERAIRTTQRSSNEAFAMSVLVRDAGVLVVQTGVAIVQWERGRLLSLKPRSKVRKSSILMTPLKNLSKSEA
ncbi:hypothetical protein BDZ91DRAFT_220459 [Kalaharituber pfeilii]|nr:hypothetical protein BDZ91DRAFT_220459 [Kalaharituber pfeilii]